MSVTTLHPLYVKNYPKWVAIEDAYEGSEAVKAKGEYYLARPSGMKRQKQYDDYRARPAWFGATERAVHGITGAVFRTPPTIEHPTALARHVQDITLTNVPVALFAEELFKEDLKMHRSGILVDFPKPERLSDGRVLLPPSTSRPYWVPWDAKEIINWRTEVRQGDTVPILVVLKECLEEPQGVFPAPGYFTCKTVTQYRVLRLDEQGHYEVSLWRERDLGRNMPTAPRVADLHDLWVPTRNGEPLTFIPFAFDPLMHKSLLEALVEINYRYYRHSADYEHGLHLTALPTPYVTGHSPEGPTFEIGSTTFIAIPEADARLGMLEFQGAGLQPHERALEADIKDMAAFGARLIEGQPAVTETLGAYQRRTEGSESPIQSLITKTSMALTQALQWHAWWAGVTEEPKDEKIFVQLNKDILSVQLEPPMVQQLVSTWLQGGMSFQTLYWNLKKGELERPGVEADEEQALIDIQQEARGMGQLVPVPTGRNGTRALQETR